MAKSFLMNEICFIPKKKIMIVLNLQITSKNAKTILNKYIN